MRAHGENKREKYEEFDKDNKGEEKKENDNKSGVI